MSPKGDNTVSDSESENPLRPTPRGAGRPPVPRGIVLAAADALLAGAATPETVSMDDIAAAAGVGKGTLFRAFGSRMALITAVFEARVAPLRHAVDSGAPPLGPGAPPVERIIAILDALLAFKLENRYLTHALETGGGQMFESDFYRWIHAHCSSALLALATPGAESGYADYAGHILLGALRTDLADVLLEVRQTPGRICSDARRSSCAGSPATRALPRRPGGVVSYGRYSDHNSPHPPAGPTGPHPPSSSGRTSSASRSTVASRS